MYLRAPGVDKTISSSRQPVRLIWRASSWVLGFIGYWIRVSWLCLVSFFLLILKPRAGSAREGEDGDDTVRKSNRIENEGRGRRLKRFCQKGHVLKAKRCYNQT